MPKRTGTQTVSRKRGSKPAAQLLQRHKAIARGLNASINEATSALVDAAREDQNPDDIEALVDELVAATRELVSAEANIRRYELLTNGVVQS